MAAGFGIWELRMPSSRAVDEDDDEENEVTEDKEHELTPSWLWSTDTEKRLIKSSKFVCSSLILAVGEVATTFLDAHFLCGNSDIVGVMTEKHDVNDFNLAMNPTSTYSIGLVHRLSQNQDCFVLQCRTHVDERKVFYWTQKIFDNIKPSKVIILTSAPVCDYMTSDPHHLPSDFLKMLHTTGWSNDHRPCGYLETPNTVRGFAASVLSHCQVHNMPAVLYVCYTATRQLDVQAVQAFGKLLESREFSVLKKSAHQETTRVLKSLGIGKSSYEHLYL